MRSLFTDDIPGAKPKHHYYDKQLYVKKHLKEIQRFGPKNPEYKRVFEWYEPVKKVVEPIDKDDSIVKPYHRSERMHSLQRDSGLSQSLILTKIDSSSVTGKVTEGISLNDRNRSSVLSQAAKKSLSDSFSADYSMNPYFPHKYANKHEQNTSKLTGRRDWNDIVLPQIQIPSAQVQYFPKWS